jgi:hypothetical protein
MLTDQVISRVASNIVEKTKTIKDPDESWKVIVGEIFAALKQDASIEIKDLVNITVGGATLATPTGPAVGAITPPLSSVDLRGKIT